MIFSRVKSAIFQLVMLLLAMMASAVAQTSTSGMPSASTTRETKSATAAGGSQSQTDEGSLRTLIELQPGEDPENRLVSPFVKHMVGDQKQFWTSPARLRTKDLKWILPAAGITAAFIASDSWWSKQVNPSHMQTSLHISDYGTYSMIGLSGASFLVRSHDP